MKKPSKTQLGLRLMAGALLVQVCSVAAGAEAEKGWPRVVTSNGNRIEVFQPQLESWQSNRLSARVAVEVKLQDDVQSRLGVVWFTASTSVDKPNRLVTLENFAVRKVQFSSLAEQMGNMQAVLGTALPKGSKTIALDRLLTASVVAQNQARRSKPAIKNDAPIVIWTTNAVAALVLVDGNPVLRPVQGSSLMRVINTASLILFDPTGGTYYLAGDGCWFQAQDISGPWAVTANPPAAVNALTPPADGTKKDANAPSPVVFVSTQPAELLHTLGAPSFKSEYDSGLMYLANSDSQVLYDPFGGTAYLLVSGRWFSSKGLSGPWTYVSAKNLPPSFAQISSAGPKAAVLSSVPGTPQAAAARVATSVPTTTTMQRSGSTFSVQYDGAPQLKPIDGTDLQYVVNASDPVILCQNQYYAVGNAVWFVAGSPAGPWAVATSVPQDIYTIPASSPLYYVTCVYVAYADDNQVEAAYTAGYTGSYDCEDGDCGPVYGTGYDYTPWTGDYYYGWGWAYGYGSQYRWWDNGWLWRPTWSGVGNLYARNEPNVYECWGPASSMANARQARAATDRALGYGYPASYGRFAGATRPAPMAVPPRATLVNPYSSWPKQPPAPLEAKGGQQLMNAAKVGSAASRDLYATPEGQIYQRREGNWYQAKPTGGWAYVAPAVGPATHPYHPETVANYDRPAAYRPPAAAAPIQSRPEETQRLDQDYYARAAGERSYQSWGGYRGRR